MKVLFWTYKNASFWADGIAKYNSVDDEESENYI